MKIIRGFIAITLLGCLLGTTYYYRDLLTNNLLPTLQNKVWPCSAPITYKIGSFDEQFGISKTEFLENIRTAEKIWESPAHKNLFTYSDNGLLTINLIYDTRQQSTNRLKQLGININSNQDTYNELTAKYNSFQSVYVNQKANFDIILREYQNKKNAYEKTVAYWNSRGGASRQTAAQLNQEATYLRSQGEVISKEQVSLNETIGNINALADVINRIAKELNINAAKFNSIGAALGGSFDEGVYVKNGTVQEINIYQFDNKDKLTRVLAHELGHALGLNHLDNPQAIMYKLNEGINEKATNDDLYALKNLCGIK